MSASANDANSRVNPTSVRFPPKNLIPAHSPSPKLPPTSSHKPGLLSFFRSAVGVAFGVEGALFPTAFSVLGIPRYGFLVEIGAQDRALLWIGCVQPLRRAAVAVPGFWRVCEVRPVPASLVVTAVSRNPVPLEPSTLRTDRNHGYRLNSA